MKRSEVSPISGLNWRGFDPTNNSFAEAEHVSVAVAREAERASRACGAWSGDAFDQTELTARVVQV